MVKITIEVPDEDHAEVWWAWYLDGGGDEGFLASLEESELYDTDDYDMDWDTDERIIRYELF